MSHCKLEHLVLVSYIQKNFNTTSKTVCIYVFCLFLSELIVVNFDHVYEWGNYNRNSIGVRPTVAILAGCKTERNIACNVTFLKNDGEDYAYGLVNEIY